MVENCHDLKKKTDIQVQEAQRESNKMIPKRATPKHIINETSKVRDKERILKAAGGKLLHANENP